MNRGWIPADGVYGPATQAAVTEFQKIFHLPQTGSVDFAGVLSAGSFGSQSMEQAVTRADAAQMLEAAGILLEGDEEPKGLFGGGRC